MSADQALTRAQERNNSKIDAAIAAGRVAQLQKSMNVTLKLTSGGSMRLVSADGTVSPEGRHYYSKLGVEPPSIFPYEQGLEAGKWMRAFDGKKKMVRRMTADGWVPTAIGLQYFKYNRDEYEIEYPTRLARPIGNKNRGRQEWQLDQETFTYTPREEPMTVAQMKGRLLATDAEKETHAREAALAWIQRQPKIKATDPSTGEQGEYHVVLYDSPKWYVYDPTRPVMVTIGRTHVYDRSNPSSDELLERPLRNFFVVPDGCYRPWDIHPLAMVKNGRCAVTMLHECFTKQCTKAKVWENGRWKYKTGHKHAMSEEQIEHELDLIFSDLLLGRRIPI